MSLERNIKCDYENCHQRYLTEPHNWWIVEKNEEQSTTGVQLRPLTKDEYAQIVDGHTLENERHCCCLDHAVKQAARFCEELSALGETAAYEVEDEYVSNGGPRD